VLEKELARREESELHLAETEERMRFSLAGSGLGTWDWDIQSNDIRIDDRWAEMLGYTLEELNFQLDTWERLIHPDDFAQVTADLQAHLDGKTPYYENTHRLLTKQGDYKWIQDRGKVFAWNAAGEPLRATGTHRDVQQEKLLERQLSELALKDALTGLPNRRHLGSVFPHAAAHAERNGAVLGLIFIDLDGFKPVNDSYGHAAGDAVLREVGQRLKRTVRGGDVVARLGGDEFCVLITHARDEQELTGAGKRLANAVSQKITVEGQTLNIGCSAGIASYPRHGRSLQALLDAADAAMYHVKNHGKGDVAFAL